MVTHDEIVIEYCVFRNQEGDVRVQTFVCNQTEDSDLDWERHKEEEGETIVTQGVVSQEEIEDERDRSFFSLFAKLVVFCENDSDQRAAMASFLNSVIQKPLVETVQRLALQQAKPIWFGIVTH